MPVAGFAGTEYAGLGAWNGCCAADSLSEVDCEVSPAASFEVLPLRLKRPILI